MPVGCALRERRRGLRGERLLEPAVEVSAVRERAALRDAPLGVHVEEEPRSRPRLVGLVEQPERPGGADHQRGAPGPDAPCAEVRADAVDDRWIPRELVADGLVPDRRQPVLGEAQRVE